MNESRHRKLEALFLECAGLPPAERAARLEARCAGDAALRAEVERLLARDEAGESRSLAPVVVVHPAAAPPPEIGPYRLGAKLGAGGFGDVYAAEQTEPIRRRVALKLLRSELNTRAVLARFELERQALALMDHPGIARVLDAGETADGRPFVAMELVEGEPITAFCDRHGLGLRERLELLVPVCRAVEHAHTKGVIHRDLKPSNILVARIDGRPVPKVIDFGIAKATHGALAETTLHTRAGEFLGTPEYASPEQAASGGADVDTRSDVYSLGVVLFRLLTGRLPLDAATARTRSAGATPDRFAERESPRPSAAVAEAAPADASAPPRFAASPRELAGDLDWIVLKALERDRDRRYPSAAALADDLEHHLRDEPVSAGPPSTGYRLGKFVRRHRSAVLGAAAVLLALVAGLVGTSRQAVRAQRAETRARLEARHASALNAFLMRMIAGANPEATPGGERATVREMVDRSLAELDAGAAGEPGIEGGMRHAIGATYLGLGLHRDAEAQLERADRLRWPAGVAPAREAFESRLALADAVARQGRYERADSLVLTLEAHRAPLAAVPDLQARALQIRGGVLANLSRYAEADSLLALAVRLGREGPAAHATLPASLLERAGVLSSLGRNEEALSMAGEAVALARREHAGDHHAVATAVARLGELRQQAGEYAAAESLLREALGIDRRVFGARHPIVAVRLSNLAWVLADEGRLEEAEAGHREAVALHLATLGEDHPTVAIARGHLATVLQSRGKLAEAVQLRRAVLAAMRRHFGDPHEEVANALNQLGSAYRLTRQYGEAAAAFREALGVFRRLFAGAHPTLAITTHNLGKTLGDAGDHAAAEPVIREALEAGRRVFPEGHINLAFFEATFGRTLAALGRFAEAEPTLLGAHARIAPALGAEHPRTIEVAREIAAMYERQGRPADAARWRKPALP